MIIHSPESPMPEPYKTYVKQRAENIADTLTQVVGDTNVQLCPRPILAEEQVFNEADNLILGSVVNRLDDGYKSLLYTGQIKSGIVAYSMAEAADFAQKLLERGERVHFKDPRESDGHGQLVAETPDQIADFLADFDELESNGVIIMPHLVHISDRFAVGKLALGRFWRFYTVRARARNYA